MRSEIVSVYASRLDGFISATTRAKSSMTEQPAPGIQELRAARRKGLGLLIWAFVFSVFVNLLMLTGPLYMLQVYDRVLTSRSVETLVALSLLVTMLYVLMGVLDYVICL